MRILLLFILLTGGLLRIVSLDRYPVGLTPDEASFGYNSYTLLRTGLDEWSVPFWQLPITSLRSFGDYKLPLYSFLTVPFVSILGLSEIAVRLPNAILGTLSILSVYLLAKKLFPHPQVRLKILTIDAGLVASFLMAFSPWSIQLSRGAFEANLITFFLPLALYAWISGRQITTAIILSLNFYSYHSARLLTFLVIPFMAILAPVRVKVSALVILVVLLLPGLWSLLGSGSSRVSDVSILSPTDDWKAVSDRRFAARSQGLPDNLSRLFSNKVTFSLSTLTKNVLSYLSPQFLFTQGAGEPTYGIIPGRGLLYYLEIPFILMFLFRLVTKTDRKSLALVGLLLLSVLPAAAAKGPGFAANRAITMLPFLAILSALGCVYLFQSFRKHTSSLLIFLSIVFLGSFTFFAEDYIYHSPYTLARGMNYGYKEVFQRTKKLANGANILFSRSLSEPHAYAAFYYAIDPKTYQNDIKKYTDFQKPGFKFMDQLGYYSMGGYEFGNLVFSTSASRSLLVGKPADFPYDFPIHFQIDYPDSIPNVYVAQRPL